MAIPVPSIVENLDETEYHADPVEGGSLSYTGMKQLLKSPAHYRYYMDAPREPKPAFDAGHIIHALVLGTPLNVIELPYADYRTAAAREERDAAYASGLIPVKPGELDPLKEIAEAVLTDTLARPLFETSLPAELSLFAPHPDFDGVTIRGRVDKIAQIGEDPVLVDLKTCQDSAPAEFARDIANFGYYLQAVVYANLWAWTHPGEPQPEMLFVAVAKTKPHLVSVNRIGMQYEDLGAMHFARAVERYAEGKRTGQWPGYAPTVWEQEPPAWLLHLEDDAQTEIII